MKTAISIPDPIFKAAERLSKKLGVSRSELYATAVLEFVGKKSRSKITEELNAVYGEESSEVNDALATMQAKSLPKEKW